MKPFEKNYFFIILLFIISTAISWQLYFKAYSQKDTVSIHTFPREIAGQFDAPGDPHRVVEGNQRGQGQGRAQHQREEPGADTARQRNPECHESSRGQAPLL